MTTGIKSFLTCSRECQSRTRRVRLKVSTDLAHLLNLRQATDGNDQTVFINLCAFLYLTLDVIWNHENISSGILWFRAESLDFSLPKARKKIFQRWITLTGMDFLSRSIFRVILYRLAELDDGLDLTDTLDKKCNSWQLNTGFCSSSSLRQYVVGLLTSAKDERNWRMQVECQRQIVGLRRLGLCRCGEELHDISLL